MKNTFRPIEHPLPVIEHDGEQFPAFFLNEEELIELLEAFKTLKPSIQTMIRDLWGYSFVSDSPIDAAEQIVLYRQTVEAKYKDAMKKKKTPKVSKLTGLPLPPKVEETY